MKNSILKVFFKIIPFKPNTGNLGMFSPSEYKKPQNFEKMQETKQGKFRTKLSLQPREVDFFAFNNPEFVWFCKGVLVYFCHVK